MSYQSLCFICRRNNQSPLHPFSFTLLLVARRRSKSPADFLSFYRRPTGSAAVAVILLNVLIGLPPSLMLSGESRMRNRFVRFVRATVAFAAAERRYVYVSASEMTYIIIVSGGALNSTHSLTHAMYVGRRVPPFCLRKSSPPCWRYTTLQQCNVVSK